MFKVKNQTKTSNKRGAMLILVLLVVSLAVILISSALMMTRSTRTRYYSFATESQARLTVTSVAESLWQSIYVQSIDDAAVKKLADGGANLTFTNLKIPGAIGGSNNSTTAKFRAVSATEVVVELESKVGDDSAQLRMILERPAPSTSATLFDYCVQLGDDGCVGDFYIGNGAPAGAKNEVFFHGDTDTNIGSAKFYSKVITTRPFMPASGNAFYNDVVLWGPNSGWKGGNGAGFKFENPNASLIFVSPTSLGQQSALINFGSDSNQNLTNVGNMILSNSVFNSDSKEMYNQVINGVGKVGYTGSAFTGSGKTADTTVSTNWNDFLASNHDDSILSKVDEYLTQEAIDKYTTAFPTYSDVSDKFGVPASAPSTAKTISNFNQLGSNPEPGVYIVSTADLTSHVTCDLSKGPYTFYVQTGGTITGTLDFINGDTAHSSGVWATMIIESNQTLKIFEGAIKSDDTASSGWVHPQLKIFGKGGVTIDLPKHASTLEAYVGLYDNAGQTSTVNFSEMPTFRGRISCKKINSTGGQADIPWAAGENDKNPSSNRQPIISAYTCAPFEYHK